VFLTGEVERKKKGFSQLSKEKHKTGKSKNPESFYL